GIRAATEEVVAFIDADDTWDPHFIEEIDTLMIHFPEAICYATNYQLVYSAGEYTDPKVRWDIPPTEPGLLKNFFELGSKGELPFQMSSFCVRKSAFDYFGYFPEGEPMGEDQDLFIRAAITGDIAYSPRILSFYHKGAENRACIRNVPNKECPFSQRLYKWATMYENKGQRQEAMIDFTAAHLLHLASENVSNNKLAEAESLLSDKRCKRHLKRYLWWKVRLLLKKTLSPFQQVPA
ncbi:MAG: glycosyltransferase, partial [Pseudomonadales bacterium]|nr:glycosyltransferase [Pseudomonadales bacterium]